MECPNCGCAIEEMEENKEEMEHMGAKESVQESALSNLLEGLSENAEGADMQVLIAKKKKKNLEA